MRAENLHYKHSDEHLEKLLLLLLILYLQFRKRFTRLCDGNHILIISLTPYGFCEK